MPPIPDTSKTNDLLVELIRTTRKQTAPFHMLFAGLMYGVGFVIGSSIIAALLINLAFFLFKDVPIFESLVRFITVRG